MSDDAEQLIEYARSIAPALTARFRPTMLALCDALEAERQVSGHPRDEALSLADWYANRKHPLGTLANELSASLAREEAERARAERAEAALKERGERLHRIHMFFESLDARGIMNLATEDALAALSACEPGKRSA